jgi:hypothetical protein
MTMRLGEAIAVMAVDRVNAFTLLTDPELVRFEVVPRPLELSR